MRSDLPNIASRRFKIPLAVLFKTAYDYCEVRKHPSNKRQEFDEFLHTKECPDCVFDFSLDLLAGITTFKYEEEEIGL